MTSFKDYIRCESIFSNREESELFQAKKKIKNILMDCIINRYTLSKRESEVYKLFYYKRMKHREISEKLNIEIATSRNYLYKANKKIEKISKRLERV